MKIPKLKKIESVKKYHGISIEDDYAWEIGRAHV